MQIVELTQRERLFYYSTLLGDANTIGLSIVNLSNVQLHDGLVKQAMFYLYKRHPLLRASVLLNREKRKIFYEIPIENELHENDMNFERSSVGNRNELIEQTEKLSSKPANYDDGSLFWRLNIMEFKEDNRNMCGILLVIPLFATDGLNICTLLIELINILNSLVQNKTCNEMVEKLLIIDSLEKLIDKNGLITDAIRENYENSLKTELFPIALISRKFFNLDGHGIKINLLILDEEFSNKLTVYAKSKGTKLSGLFASTAFYALKDLYAENKIRIQKDVNVYVSVSMRFRVEPSVDFSHCRYYTSGCGINLLYPHFGQYIDVWNDAQHINCQIQKAIQDGTNLYSYVSSVRDHYDNLFYQTGDVKKFSTILSNSANTTLILSNIGTYVSNEKKLVDGPISLEEIYHGETSASDASMISPFSIHVGTFKNRIMFMLTSNRHRFNANHVDRFMVLLEKHIRNSIN